MKQQKRASIVPIGMGGFLNPPTHPEHTSSVNDGQDGAMCLTSAATCEWLDAAVRAEAKRKLDEWRAPAIDGAEVQSWIRQVLGYFRNCYRNPDKSGHEQWHVSHILIRERNPIENAADHCGVHLIRYYYPTYQPTAEQFAEARWGDDTSKRVSS